MSQLDSVNAFVSINNVDISASCRKVSFPGKWVNNDVTAFGSVGRRYNPSIDETKFTLELWYNETATNGSHTVVGNVFNAKSTVAFAIAWAGNTNGKIKFSGNCSIPEYEVVGQVASAVTSVAVCYVDNGVTIATI
jgi:hypothetical protein